MDKSARSLKLTTVMFRAFSQVQHAIAKDIEGYGLNTSEFGTLDVLYHKGQVAIQEVGKRMLMANSSMTYVVDKLEGRGFLAREKLESDRRSVMIRLTEEGKTFFETIFETHQQTLNTLYGDLSEAEKDVLTAHLKTIGYKAMEHNNRSKGKGRKHV